MTIQPGEADQELEAMNARAYDEAGVDVTQIDAMLALSPAERLVMLYETALSLSRLMSDADADARV
jgi:hypothetical protein